MASRPADSRRSKSPATPPWSPISPGPAISALTVSLENQPVNLPQNVPISESTNTDVIALRAALAVLQMQRLQSIQNIKTLDKQRDLALAYPEEFRQQLVNGNIHSQREADTIFDEEDKEDHEPDIADSTADISPLKDFGKMPAALHIVRCPPVNWTKYHIAGEVLDQLHEQQRRLPHSGQATQSSSTRPHVIAAPYSPWQDKLAEMPKSKTTGGT